MKLGYLLACSPWNEFSWQTVHATFAEAASAAQETVADKISWELMTPLTDEWAGTINNGESNLFAIREIELPN